MILVMMKSGLDSVRSKGTLCSEAYSKGPLCSDSLYITVMYHEEELLTRSFGIKHGAFTRGTHVDDNALLVGGRVVVWICDRCYARHSKTH